MKFPNKLTSLETFYEYLKEVLIESKSLTLGQIKKIFLKALKDYFEKNINDNYLNTVACQLYHVLKPSYEIDLDRELGKTLSEATELNYYSKEKPKKYERVLKILKDYYQKNINFLKD